MKAQIKVGARGQFDVLLDGELVASKSNVGLFAKLLGAHGFPDDDKTVAAVKARLGK